jgi:hypothetical protein
MSNRFCTGLAIVLLLSSVAAAAPPPYPPPPAAHAPLAVVETAPPPLSPLMRAVYAPFYVAGLVARYGLYYVVVAPLEVFSRAVNYGPEGGVEPGGRT